jgi:hypothetical protein
MGFVRVDRNHNVIASGEALQNSPHVTELIFNSFEVDHEASVSFMKSAIYGSFLRKLDWWSRNYVDVLKELASWHVPQDCNESTLQDLCMSGNELTQEQTMKDLVMFLQLHVPKLK